VLANACVAGDVVVIEVYNLVSIANALPSTGGTVTGPTTFNSTVAVGGAATFNSSVTINGGSASGYTGYKNRVINPRMTIDQRNAGAAVTYTNSNSYNLDRYLTDMSPGGSLQIQQVSDAPAGFVYSMKGTVLTATAGSSGQAAYLARHIIEGSNIADFSWGSASAQTVTLSFWVKSSVTGTFSVGVANSAFNRGYAATYAINAANTWEFKSLVIPGDTSGTWLTNNGIGIRLYWNIGSGSNFLGAASTWQSSGLIGATGSTSIIGTLNATFQITGAQLEKGSTATPFEFRSIGQELALCQRYYEFGTNEFCFGAVGLGAGNDVKVMSGFKATKRTAPTVTATSIGSPIVVSASAATVDKILVSYTAGNNNNFFSTWTASAEL
jgi:hypothetical protein